MNCLVQHYTIAICTQGKNPNLSSAISSLLQIKKSTKYEIEILVVLNSSRPNIETSSDIRVILEPTLGYSSVRNTALKSAKVGSSLIFIDDDEIPSKTWFENLVLKHEKYNDEIIVGPVYPYQSDLLEKKSYRSQFTQLYKSRPDEAVLNQGATANMLIPASLIGQDITYFDLHFNQSGSEDTDFCFRMRKAGYMIRYAKDAAILELETDNKFDLDYINKRFIRDVANYSVVLRRNMGPIRIFYRFLTLTFRIVIFGVLGIFYNKHSIKFEAYCASFICLVTGKVRH